MRKSERDVIVTVSGGPTHRNFGRTAGSPDSDVVAPTADPEIGLVKAGALSKTNVMVDPGPPEGPRREAVATTRRSFIALHISEFKRYPDWV